MATRFQRTPHEWRAVCDVHGVVSTGADMVTVQAGSSDHADCETDDAQD